jgi:hypothetical protein
MSDRPEQPPEGRLIAMALKRSKLSGRKAANRAGMSEGRWRQIVSGYQTISQGVYAPVHGPAETVARMAQVVGVTPEELDDADRPDAAEELRHLTHAPTLDEINEQLDENARNIAELTANARPLSPRQQRALIEVAIAMRESDEPSNDGPSRSR